MNTKVRRWLLLPTMAGAALLSVSLLFVVTAPRTEAQSQETSSPSSEKLEVLDDPGEGTPGPLSSAQERAISQGYLVPDQNAYEQAKDEATAKAEQLSGETSSSPSSSSAETLAPQETSSFGGVYDTCCGPSDSTGAVGTNRYVELVNSKFAIKSRKGKTIKTSSLNSLVPGAPSSHFVFDPQIIWDPGTQRFFYAADDVVSSTDNRIVFGFSKTPKPSSAADFCKYSIKFGSEFPDYPKLGDTQDFLLIGTNTFNGNTFRAPTCTRSPNRRTGPPARPGLRSP